MRFATPTSGMSGGKLTFAADAKKAPRNNKSGNSTLIWLMSGKGSVDPFEQSFKRSERFL